MEIPTGRSRAAKLSESELRATIQSAGTRTELFLRDTSAYRLAQKTGLLELLPDRVITKRTWNKEACMTEALKYQRRSDFQSGNSSAYMAARLNGWLDEACAHMPPPRKRKNQQAPTKWTPEAIFAQAQKAKSPADFRERFSCAYRAAIRQELLSKVNSLIVNSEPRIE